MANHLHLNAEQLRAVQSSHPNTLVIAGPGTGKTRVIAARVQHLLDTGVSPQSIAVITFTKKAANELKHRIGTPLFFTGTLHSLLFHLYQERFPGAASMIDPETEKARLREHLQSCKATTKNLVPFDWLAYWMGETQAVSRDEKVTASFYARMKSDGLVSFDGLIAAAPTLLKRIRLEHLIVDEYQDTGPEDEIAHNSIQTENRFYVGDPRQVLYDWRGVDPGLMQRVADTFQVFRLDSNHRCSSNIVKVAEAIAGESFEAIKEGGTVLVVKSLYDVEIIEKESIAFLCRYNADVADTVSWLVGQGLFPVVSLDNGWVEGAIAVLSGYLIPSHQNVLTSIRIAVGEHEAKAVAAQAANNCDTAAAVSKYHILNADENTLLALLPLWGKFKFRHNASVGDALRAIEESSGAITIGEMMEELQLVRDQIPKLDTSKGIHVMTVHQAKGLEFNHVVIVNATNEGFRIKGNERTLFVAVTRAIDKLTFHCPGQWDGLELLKGAIGVTETEVEV
jgi:superfamily I DNA/RNA helicase